MRTRTRIRTWARMLLAAACLLASAVSAAAAPLLYIVRENDPELRVVDAADASTIATHTVTLPGEDVFGSSGLARHPITGDLYALLWLSGQVGRELVTLDGSTGSVISRIGDTGDFFTALAFDAAGALYALTHDDAATPSTLYTISLSDAAPTFAAALGNGGYGEALGFNPLDGRLYHASGEPGDRVFESIDPDGFAVTPIATSGDLFDEVLALASAGGASFYMTDYLGGPGSGGVSDLYRISADGVVTRIGHLGFSDARGIAIVPEPGTALLVLGGLLALGARGRTGH